MFKIRGKDQRSFYRPVQKTKGNAARKTWTVVLAVATGFVFLIGAGAYATGKYRNLFAEAGYSPDAIAAKINHSYEQLFHGDLETQRLYFPSGENENGPLAYIPDIQHNDVRSEGMSYGMMSLLHTAGKFKIIMPPQ